MKSLSVSSLGYFLILFLSFQITTVFGQDKTDPLHLKSIDGLEAAIREGRTLVQTQQVLEAMKQQALKSHNDVLFARTLYNLMQIRDRRTEDTAYFRNSAFIDTLLTTTASPKLKAILHLMRAQRISKFDNQYHRFNIAAYRTPHLKSDYAALGAPLRDSVVANDFDAALKYGGTTDGKQLLWLSSNPDVFLFDPKFGDIILSERINTLVYNYSDRQISATDWLSLSSTAFKTKLDSLAGKKNNNNKILAAYQRWFAFNESSSSVTSFIESLTRKYIYLSAQTDTLARQSYINYLKESLTSLFPAVKAHAVYQLCLIWNEEGNKYTIPGNRFQYQPAPNFSPQYQFYPAKALQLYQQHKALMADYPVFNQVLNVMEQQIRSLGMRIEMEDQHLPGQEIPLLVSYKNTDKLYYRIIRIGSTERPAKLRVSATAELLNRKPVAEGTFNLPLPPDYNRHAVHLKLERLPIGHYRLLFNNMPIKVDSYDLHNITFEVTGITAINTDERVFILDRKTGFPLTGAHVKAFKKKIPIDNVLPDITAKGYIKIAEGVADSINITYKGDTTGYIFSVSNNKLGDNQNVYNKDDFDNLPEFYNDKLRMEIFTDRSIYRPGQTVQYKIIFLTNDPNTGDPILLNQQNIGKKLLEEWLDDANDEITLKDPFGKKIDSAVLKINDFGSFAGSFTIPKAAATGSWSIGGIPETGRQNSGDFKVEEYKRPTIELSVEKQKKMLMPGQPFTIKLKMRSLSGADLGSVPIKYAVNRSGQVPSTNPKRNSYYYGDYTDVRLKQETGYTNERGELLISISDSALVKVNQPDSVVWSYTYSVSATAVDATGESTDVEERLSISSRPVKINIPLGKTYDRQALPVLNVNTSADFEGTVGRKVNIKLYEVSNPDNNRSGNKQADQWYYKETDWNQWFPNMATHKAKVSEKALMLDTIINTANYEKFALPKNLLTAGFYQLVAVAKDSNRVVGQSSYTFNVFDSKTGDVLIEDIDYMPFNAAKPGDILTWYSSAKSDNYTIYQIIYAGGKKRRVIKNIYEAIIEKPGVRTWKYKIPSDAMGQLLITRISVRDNKINAHDKRIYLNTVTAQPLDIVVEKYRKVMVPGAKEEVILSVKTKNDNIAAELLTTLYDASLDKLEEHRWQLPDANPPNNYFYTSWNASLTALQQVGNYTELSQPVTFRELQAPGAPGAGVSYALQGKLAGVSISNASGLNEVVVIGYGTDKRSDVTGSVSTISIRGVGSLQDYSQPLVVLDGEIFTGDLKSVNMASITQAIVLKGADATALYGARAAQGVLIISTKGPIVLPGSEEPVVKIRKNFNETAFFFPQVHADKDGYYKFSFNMPETATEWNWKMLAHTRKARFAYLEKKLQTQLNLMVQPNMPRLLYQGDKINLQSRITNLDSVAIQGKATCKIEDAVTGEDITAALTSKSDQTFSLNKKSSGAVSFSLRVPSGQLNPLKIVITALIGSAADAEEHTIPVLSSRVFIRKSQAITFANQPTITISPAKLPADAALYGMGISITQKPQASLIYALPWLANYSFNCAEQTFNKLRAHVTALQLMQKDTVAQSEFKKVADFIENNKPAEGQLPDELAEEAMPWLGISNHAATQQKQLFSLLDTSVTKQNIAKHLDKLYTLQQLDGGLAWFEGGRSNAYISAYVLAGFGQLKQTGWAAEISRARKQQEFITKLLKYQDGLLSSAINEPYNNLFQIYAMSYWTKDNPLSAQGIQKTNTLLSNEWQNINSKGLYQQALLIINTLKYAAAGSALYTKAQRQLENIRQLAIQDAANGLRWKEIADSEDMNSSAEETMALLAEAFKQSGKYKDVDAGIIKWLLTAKQDAHWQTTKGTAAAINMLQKERGNTFGETKAITVQLADQKLSVSDGLLDGVPTALSNLKQLPKTITIQQQGTNVSGALTWYYFAAPDKLDTLNKAVRLSKQFYSYDKDKGWMPLTPTTMLKPGDRVQVKLIIETTSRLKFVHINDPRSAAFEPKEIKSGYRYNNGLSYYQSVRDTGLDLFTEAIPRGISEIVYELVVAHDGEFTSGPARLQCMYQPAVTAYSGIENVKTSK